MLPRCCSGAMYAGVPTAAPSCASSIDDRDVDRRDRGVGASASARQAEVGDAHAAVVADQHVLGLEVAVDEPGGVRGGEAAAGLRGTRRAPRATAAVASAQPRAQRRARRRSSIATNTAVADVPTS